jgi:hypothetical protein
MTDDERKIYTAADVAKATHALLFELLDALHKQGIFSREQLVEIHEKAAQHSKREGDLMAADMLMFAASLISQNG